MESFYYDAKELCSTKRDLRNYDDSCHKESERCTEYPEQSTANFNNVANITINDDSIDPQNKQNWREEDCQEDHQIFD